MNHFGLEIIRSGFADLRCSGLVGGVVGDQHLLVRLRQDGMDKTMIFQNSLIGQLVISCIDYLMYRSAQWRAMDGALAHGYFLQFGFSTDMACEHES